MYEQEWKLVEVNADNSIEWVTEDIISKLNLK
jgi:thymidylate kinase